MKGENMKIFKIMVIAFVLFIVSVCVFNYIDHIWSGVAIEAALHSSIGNYNHEAVHRAELLQNIMVICKCMAFGCGALAIGCGIIGFFKVIFGK